MSLAIYKLSKESINFIKNNYTARFSTGMIEYILCDEAKKSIAPPIPRCVKIEGIAYDDSMQALLIKIDGSTVRPDGKLYTLVVSKEPYRKDSDADQMWKTDNSNVEFIDGPCLSVYPMIINGNN